MARRRRDLDEPDAGAPVMDGTFAASCLPRLMFAAEPSQLATDIYAALRVVEGRDADARLERMWGVLDAFGLREAGERFLERQWALSLKRPRRSSGRHDERTSL